VNELKQDPWWMLLVVALAAVAFAVAAVNVYPWEVP
jgi:hypothetical protein